MLIIKNYFRDRIEIIFLVDLDYFLQRTRSSAHIL